MAFDELLDKEKYKLEVSLLSAADYRKKDIGESFWGNTAFCYNFLPNDEDFFRYWIKDPKDSITSPLFIIRDSHDEYPFLSPMVSSKDCIFRPVINVSKALLTCLKYERSEDGRVKFGFYPNNSATSFSDKKIIEKLQKYKRNSFFRDRKIKKESPLKSVPFDNNVYKFKNDYYIEIGNKFYHIAPIEWEIDEKNYRLICKKGLIAGLKFEEKDLNFKTFSDSPMYKYLNTLFIDDLLRFENIDYEIEKISIPKEKITSATEVAEEKTKRKKISIGSDLELIDEIEYNLSLLKEINPDKYRELSDKYNNCKNNNSDVTVLAMLSGEISAVLLFDKKKYDVFNYMDKEKNKCLNNFIKGINNDISFEKLDKIFDVFLTEQKSYDVKTKGDFISNLAFLYFVEAYEQRHTLTIAMLENTHFEFFMKGMLLWIKYFINQGDIECNYFLNSSTDINLKNMIDIIQNIDLKKHKLHKK